MSKPKSTIGKSGKGSKPKSGKNKSTGKTKSSKKSKVKSKKSSSKPRSEKKSKHRSKSKASNQSKSGSIKSGVLPKLDGTTMQQIQIFFLRQKDPNFGRSSAGSNSKKTQSKLSKILNSQTGKSTEKSQEDNEFLEIETIVDDLKGCGKSAFAELPEMYPMAKKSSKSKSRKSSQPKSQSKAVSQKKTKSSKAKSQVKSNKAKSKSSGKKSDKKGGK